ncbi:hypothetical protein NLG97_g6693 [Lecanicillium saksenae]|uniref:Uncharacterized protein n=1 Tax=Lecanicillium saksenae TaxID=468837 RepID=A0ACC1QS11_9HYPO|nr:hypothetical protein NLG97_g6693 [Lecanicillium saksenae]
MGLPLFVAPVESDVARKSAHKLTTSPSRTSIRRVDRASERERQRNVARRAAARIYGPVQRTLSTINQERPLPWIESGAASENTVAGSEERLRSMQDSLREMARNDARRNQRMEQHMAEVFGTSWHDLPPGPPAEEEQQEADLGWWSIDPRGRARRPRMITPISSRFTRSPDTLGATRARTSSPFATENSSQGEQGNRRAEPRPLVVSTGMDGLGDHPQPPSANTSFASATGTQSASQSQTAPQPSTTGGSILPDGFDDAPVDAGCDSGCEHSDIDEADLEDTRRSLARSRQRNLQFSAGFNFSRPTQAANTEQRVLQQRSSRFGRENPEAPTGSERQALNRVPMPGVHSQEAWVGRALVGAGDQENADGPRHGTVSTLSSLTSAPAEEDWSGMQRIMRSLARREDIPEEWWAEAGLSRTLSRQGTN